MLLNGVEGGCDFLFDLGFFTLMITGVTAVRSPHLIPMPPNNLFFYDHLRRVSTSRE